MKKRYYQIREVAEITGVNESTLRNWEEQHTELKNVRRINNRRHYTEADIATIERINKSRTNKSNAFVARASLEHNEEISGDAAAGYERAKTIAPAKQMKRVVADLRNVQKQLRNISKLLS